MEKTIYVEKSIMHVLDESLGEAILSDVLHPVSADVNAYITKQIEKLLKDKDIRVGEVKEQEMVYL